MGFYGWLGSLQDPPYHQVNHTGGCTHKINYLCVAHIAHICGIHLEIEESSGDLDEQIDTTLLYCALNMSNVKTDRDRLAVPTLLPVFMKAKLS